MRYFLAAKHVAVCYSSLYTYLLLVASLLRCKDLWGPVKTKPMLYVTCRRLAGFFHTLQISGIPKSPHCPPPFPWEACWGWGSLYVLRSVSKLISTEHLLADNSHKSSFQEFKKLGSKYYLNFKIYITICHSLPTDSYKN